MIFKYAIKRPQYGAICEQMMQLRDAQNLKENWEHRTAKQKVKYHEIRYVYPTHFSEQLCEWHLLEVLIRWNRNFPKNLEETSKILGAR